MHRAKANAEATVPICVVELFRVVGAAVVEETTLATPDEPPPQPAASSDNAATTTTEARMSERRQRIGQTVGSRPIRRVARKRCLSAAAQR
jgi:hypothetical protein